MAVRATWRGTLAREVGPLPLGAALTAHTAAVISVEDGRIRDHEVFDRNEPLPVPGRCSSLPERPL